MARQAAIAIQKVDADRRFEELVQKTLEHRGTAEEILTPILDAILDCFGFDEGILYRADPKEDQLKVAAWRVAPKFAHERETWSHRISTTSIASYAYKAGEPRLSLDPENDSEVNQTGRAKFEILGPILAMPLSYCDNTVGSLVVWNRQREFPAHLTQEQWGKMLEPFTRLAAAKVELWKGELEPEARVAYEWMKSPAEDSLCILIKDRDLRFTFANVPFLRFVGLKKLDDLRGQDDFFLFPPDLAKKYQHDDRKVLAGDQLNGLEEPNQLKDSSDVRYVRVFKRAILDRAGRVTGILCIFWDRTLQKRLELRQKQLLFKEVPHRVKGDLSRLKEHLESELRGASPEARKSLNVTFGRVLAMWHRIDILYSPEVLSSTDAGSSERVPMKRYLSELVPSVLKAEAVEDRITANTAGVTDAAFDKDIALDCALIVNELVSNSIQHGFAGKRRGTVTVTLIRNSSTELLLSVGDDGVGIHQNISDPSQCGRGLKWVHELVGAQYQGSLTHRGGNVEITLRVPEGLI